MTPRLLVLRGGAVPGAPVSRDPWEYQAACVEAFVASWRARGFSPVTIGNDIGQLERALRALGRPAWEVTPEDIDRVVGDLAAAGRTTATRREYVQVFKGFHRFLQARKAAGIEVAFGVKLVCPVDEFNASRRVGDDSPAELLILLYAQTAATVSRLTTGHIQASGNNVRIRLGREPVVLPEPLDALILQVVAARHGHAAIGGQETSPWLFPGGQLGVRSGQSRSAALFQLATDLPAALLARLLGIHISVAVAWQRASAGDWMAYAADISRRGTGPAQPAADTRPTPT